MNYHITRNVSVSDKINRAKQIGCSIIKTFLPNGERFLAHHEGSLPDVTDSEIESWGSHPEIGVFLWLRVGSLHLSLSEAKDSLLRSMISDGLRQIRSFDIKSEVLG